MFTHKSPVHTKKKYQKRRLTPETLILIKQCLVGFLVLALFVGVVIGVWYGTRVPSLTISTVTASGGETIDPSLVESSVQRALEGQYLKLIPKRFAWWYPHDDVLAAASGVPRVKNPHVTRVSGTELSVSYEEYIPFALWCDGAGSTRCVFIDAAGFAFATAPALVGGSLGRYIATDVPAQVGISAPFASDVAVVEAWLWQLEQVTPLAAEITEIDTMHDAFIKVAGGGEIKISLNDDLNYILENLTSILASEEFADITPGTFQYIDLRFGSKVFVNTEIPSVASSTATTSDLAASSSVLTEVVEDIAASVSEVTETTLRTVGTTTAEVATTTTQ